MSLQALDRAWEAAQETGAVLAAEPLSDVVGSRAGRKKTGALAGVLLKFFVYGSQPNWFPADVIRRTVCGSDPRWSCFWHLASGEERDLHPWLDAERGFAQLVGSHHLALLKSAAIGLRQTSARIVSLGPQATFGAELGAGEVGARRD
jgi:hypothetical protein